MSLKLCRGKTTMVISDLQTQSMARREVATFCEAFGIEWSGEGWQVVEFTDISRIKKMGIKEAGER